MERGDDAEVSATEAMALRLRATVRGVLTYRAPPMGKSESGRLDLRRGSLVRQASRRVRRQVGRHGGKWLR